MNEEKHRIVCNSCRKAKSPWFPSADEAEEWAKRQGWMFIEPLSQGVELYDKCPACQAREAN